MDYRKRFCGVISISYVQNEIIREEMNAKQTVMNTLDVKHVSSTYGHVNNCRRISSQEVAKWTQAEEERRVDHEGPRETM